MTQAEIELQARAAQIEVSIAQADVLGDRRVVGNRERRRLRLVQQPDLLRQHLDFTGVELRVDGVGAAQLHGPQHGDDELGSQLLGDGHHGRVVRHQHLRNAVAIADVEEQQAAEIANPMDPAEEDDLRADVGRTERAAGVCAGEGAELVCH